MEASCCVARKIFLSEASASSRARMLDSRPTTNGVIMNGKMTTSRMGIIGSFLVSNFSLVWLTRHASRGTHGFLIEKKPSPQGPQKLVIRSLLHRHYGINQRHLHASNARDHS